jgi:hypothetical protein
MPVKTVIKLRNGTAAQWTSTNPTLVKGELGIETDTNKFKFGDGTTAWTALPYVVTSSGSTTVDWADVLNKPATFTPSSHTHPTSDVTGLDTALAGKASTTHTHAQADVTDLTTDLAAKAPLVSPSFTTPSLGVATATSINGTTVPSSSTLVTTAAGTATAATNIAGGAASQIPYQSAANTTAFVANGTAGQVLTSNGTSAPSFQTIAAGSLTLIADVTTASSATSASITSIPQTYKALKLVYWFIGGSSPGSVNITFNGATNGYHNSIFTASATGGSATMVSSGTIYAASISGLSMTANTPQVRIFDGYQSGLKTMGTYIAGLIFSGNSLSIGASMCSAETAVTSMEFTMGNVSGVVTRIQLYGVN